MVENNNVKAEGEIKALGFPTVDNESILKATRSTGLLQKILKKSNDDLGLSKRHTDHPNKTGQDVFNCDLNQINKQAAVFSYSPGRQYASFPGLKPISKSINCN